MSARGDSANELEGRLCHAALASTARRLAAIGATASPQYFRSRSARTGVRAGGGFVTVGAKSLTGNGGPGSVPAGRALSLRQLREMIEEVYASKAKLDDKCAKQRLPRETLAQHLSTYLNNRYGLKQLVHEYSSACLEGVRTFEHLDADVATFAAVLRCEVEEGFVALQSQLKHTIMELLRVYLRGKMPQKTDKRISELLQERMDGFILHDEWSDIVRYMYAEADCRRLSVQVREVAARQHAELVATNGGFLTRPSPRGASSVRQRSGGGGGGGVGQAVGVYVGGGAAGAQSRGDGRLPYASFVQVLLDYQLSGHVQYLEAFVEIWRTIQPQASIGADPGLISEEGFHLLTLELSPERFGHSAHAAEAMQDLLAEVDPYNHQRISFSDCVAVFGPEIARLQHQRQYGGPEYVDLVDHDEP